MLKGKIFCYYHRLPWFIGTNSLVNDLVQTDLAIMRFAWDCVNVVPNCTLGLFGDAIASCIPCKGIRIAEFRKFLPVESGIRKIRHAYEMVSSRLWNPEYSSRNPESYYRLTSGIQVPLTKNPESSAWNPEPKTGLDCLPWGKRLLSLAIAKLCGELGQNLAPKQFHTAVRRPSLQ